MALGMRRPAGALHGAGEPSGLTVLVADDESVVRTTIGRILKTRGFRVLQSVDGLQALEIAAHHPGPIHLLVTDVQLPGLDGEELRRRLSSQRPETRTLFMSGSPATDLQPPAAFLSKPFDAGELVGKVCEVLQILELGRNPAVGKGVSG